MAGTGEPRAEYAQATDQRSARAERIRWGAGWVATLALALWLRSPSWTWLTAAAGFTLLWTLLSLRAHARRAAIAAAVLWFALLFGVSVQLRLGEVARGWDLVRFSIEEDAESALSRDLDALVDRGEAAVDSAIAVARGQDGDFLFGPLSRVRERMDVSAVAVFGPDGAPLAWAGEHRGTIPDTVRRGLRPYFFSSGPLFGYLYFTRSFEGGRTAIAAVLLEASVAAGEGGEPFSEVFSERHGITPRFTTPARAQGESVWDWGIDTPILSVSFVRLTQERWRARLFDEGRWGVGAGWLAAVFLLSLSWTRRGRDPGVPAIVVTAGLFLIPLGEMVSTGGLFSPLGFVLPLPVDVTLGEFLILLAGAGVWLLARGRPRWGNGAGGVAVRVLLAGLVLPVILGLVRSSASSGLLADASAGGTAIFAAGTLALALPLFLLLPRTPSRAGARMAGRLWAPAALLSVALGLWVVAGWGPEREVPPWTPVFWALPFALFAIGLGRTRLGKSVLLPWLAAGWIGGTAAASHLWVAHMDARVSQAERELARLGTTPDPYLDFLLRQFSERVLQYSSQGREGVGLLYQAWVSGGLAGEGYEARVTLWQEQQASAELRLSDVPRLDSLIVPMLARAGAAEEPQVERYTAEPNVHYLLLVPLAGGRIVSVVVPPRRHLGRSNALARVLDSGRATEDQGGPTALSLVPLAGVGAPDGARADTMGALRWLRTDDGWRSETLVAFPSGPMHAHLLLRTPSYPLLLVRAALALALVLGGMVFLWALGRTLCGEPFGVARGEWGWTRTFRGRLTLALFAFFLLPMAVFGATAYQALAREVVRTASAVAQRALEQAVGEAHGQPIAELGEHVGTDLLLYQNGVLTGAAPPEVVDLGLYDTWLPPALFASFARSEEVRQVEEQRLGGREYLIAYRRLGPAQVLAAPTPLASGEIVRRQGELANLVFLAVLVGGALSIILSLMVGRALSRPIEDLSRAAAAVGAGKLRVRLPETRGDEFGGLYRSFNRMVRRIHRARAAVIRETRRTEAVVAEAGTGVLALDDAGRVALINARGGEILGTPPVLGEEIPEATPISAAVARAARAFRQSDEEEHGEEIELEGRVVRLRLRRLKSETGTAAVVALEDITSEIRAARVLAWGEMARQVAHEIKNPLTPIKLSVQHLRRAYADGRPDFQKILDRNVDAILLEIDRLGEIARAFARFGTPSQTAGDLEAVDLRAVVEETLALYRSADDGVEYRVAVDAAVPRAYARVGELKEVLVNLLENARAALGAGGEVRLSAARDAEGWVLLEIADTGEGIGEDLLHRVWEPQFSTRSSGTGLGLAIVRRLVESWGGEVNLRSAVGEGTTVGVRLRGAGGGSGREHRLDSGKSIE